MLAEELGLEPSAELRRLEQQVLQQDPELDVRAAAARVPAARAGRRGLVRGRSTARFQPQVGREVAREGRSNPALANDPEFIRRFEAEAQLVARLEHPHIVPLYDYWREPDGAYLVMRYLRGGSLRERARGRAARRSTSGRLLDQVGAALAAAHRQGVVHRDVKPANILLDEEGNAYLADFGIAKDVEAPSAPGHDNAPTARLLPVPRGGPRRAGHVPGRHLQPRRRSVEILAGRIRSPTRRRRMVMASS